MSNNAMISRVENNRVLVLERTFEASRDLLFKVFTEAEHLKQWFGPKGWALPVCSIDFRVGGVWHYCMKCVDETQGDWFGMESWGKGIFKEIDEPNKFVYTDYFSDAEGNTNDAKPSFDVTLEFIDLGGKTKLINRAEFATAEALKTVMDMGHLEGTSSMYDDLQEYLNEVK